MGNNKGELVLFFRIIIRKTIGNGYKVETFKFRRETDKNWLVNMVVDEWS